MAKNEERREALLDAGLEVLARRGARGLTHRAVDQHAQVPEGTCANYFRSKDALFEGLGERIFTILTPDEEELAASAEVEPGPGRMLELMEELMGRVLARPNLQLALLELRLEATRRPALARSLIETLHRSFLHDVAFHERARLPGGELEVTLLHIALDGLILNTLTLPDVLGIPQRPELLAELVTRIMPSDAKG